MVVTYVEQTREEKLAMYMKLTKAELAEMLLNANAVLEALTAQPSSPFPPQPGLALGCVCPPGAERTCGSTACPRKAFPSGPIFGVNNCSNVGN